MRVIKPEAGKATKLSEDLMDSGDGAWYPVVGGLSTLTGFGLGIPLGFVTHEGFFALVIPGIFFLFTVFNYLRGTAEIRRFNAEHYQRTVYKHWPKIKGSSTAELAWPMVQQIYKCSVEGHPGAGARSCNLCSQRESLIQELIPNEPGDTKDIDTVKRYLEMRKEAEVEHAKAMKELLS